MKPETLYTNVGDAQVAYQVFGDGPDLVYSIGYFVSHVDLLWEQPDFARFLQRLGSFARVTIFDRRGTGASDPLTQSGGSWWEDWVDDLDAVLAATGAERPSLMASTDAGPMAIAFAATYPERVASLVLMNTGARSLPAPDYPHGVPEEHRGFGRFLEEAWGKEDGPLPDVTWPARAGDPEYRRWIAQVQRAIMTPRRAAALWAMEMEVDVRRAVPLIQAPTLVVSTDFPLIPVGNSEYLAEHIAGARLLMLEGRGAFGWLEDAERLLEGIEELVTGEHKPVEPDRVLATVLFTDIVGSTERAAELGDRRWRELLDRHDQVSRREVGRHGGKLVKTTGDGILATFDGPARAIRSAAAIRDGLAREGVSLRLGLHAGEIEVRGEDVGGIAVHIAARVMAQAEANEVLVSGTVKGLVAGSGLAFTDRGTATLKGIPDEWPLFALA